MKNVTDSRMKKASILGLLVCAFFYMLVGNVGYCLFGDQL